MDTETRLKKVMEELTARRKNPPTLKTASFTIDVKSYENVSKYLQESKVSFSSLINEYIKALSIEIDEIRKEEKKK